MQIRSWLRRCSFYGILSIATVVHLQAATVLSNLGVPWIGGGIGDFHGLFPGGSPYGNMTAHFFTGLGTYSVDQLILEFDNRTPLDTMRQMNVQLFEDDATGSSLVGSFTNLAIGPHGGYTHYEHFFPASEMRVKSLMAYSLVLSLPAGITEGAALLFNISADYFAEGAWKMSPTTSGNPYAFGEYLKLRLDATLVPPDRTPPRVSASTSPSSLWPPDSRMVPVTISGIIQDDEPYGTGVRPGSAAYLVADEYGLVQPAGLVPLQADGSFSFIVYLQAARRGEDRDGRRYIITVTAQDEAGNTGLATAAVEVPHGDRRRPTPFLQQTQFPGVRSVRGSATTRTREP